MAGAEKKTKSRRPRLSLLRVIGGALVDAIRLSPAILGLEAVLVGTPAALSATRMFDTGGLTIALGFIAVEVVAASAFQALLLRLAGGRKGQAGMIDVRAIARLTPATLALNLLALILVGVGGILGAFAANFAFSMTGYRGLGFLRSAAQMAGVALGAGAGMLFLTRWAATAALVAVDGEDLTAAMVRSAALSAGQMWRVAVLQAGVLGATLLALLGAININGTVANMPMGMAAFIAATGLIFAIQALAGRRLLRELLDLDGAAGAADLAAVFE